MFHLNFTGKWKHSLKDAIFFWLDRKCLLFAHITAPCTKQVGVQSCRWTGGELNNLTDESYFTGYFMMMRFTHQN